VRYAWRSLVAACSALLVAGALIVWDRDFRRASGINPGMSCPQIVLGHGHLPLAAFGVHRVALIGDSIMFQPSCALAGSLTHVGITTARYAVPGSGLLTGTVDWIAETKHILATDHPDAVLAIFVGNYYRPPIRDAHGNPIEVDTPAFFAAWQHRAEELSDIVRAAGAQMYWVSPPPITLLPRATRLYDGYRTIDGDHFLDSGSVLARHGKEIAWLRTCGLVRVVRSPTDTVHLTDDGARIYGQQIAHDLTAHLGILATPRPC
jgi:hypothetical protein